MKQIILAVLILIGGRIFAQDALVEPPLKATGEELSAGEFNWIVNSVKDKTDTSVVYTKTRSDGKYANKADTVTLEEALHSVDSIKARKIYVIYSGTLNNGSASILGLNSGNLNGTIGVRGHSASIAGGSSPSIYGVYGLADGTSNTSVNYGVFGSANSGNVNYGGYFMASGGVSSYAGYFDGKVESTSDIKGETLTSVPSDTTVTAERGRIVYKTSDNHFYGCRATTGKKWYQLDQ